MRSSRRRTRRHPRISTAAVGVCVLVCALLLPAAPAAPLPQTSLTCSNIEAGPPGDAGNVLRVQPEGDFSPQGVMLYRDGSAIRVFDAPAYFFEPSSAVEVPCSGPPPTVTDIDSIEIADAPGEFGGTIESVVIDESGREIRGPDGVLVGPGAGGLFAPGATPEANGSEIEISFTPRDRDGHLTELRVVGSAADDDIVAGSRGGSVELNLDLAADGPQPDADVTSPSGGALVIGSGAGDDRISGTGGSGTGRKLHGIRPVFSGAEGNDVLLGYPGPDYLLGGSGDDLLRGGAGNDGDPQENGSVGLYDGPGDDRVYGGPGNDELGDAPRASGHDRMFGGPGHDTFYESDRARDVLLCGPGVERDVQFDHGLDRLRGCERSARE